MPKSLTSIIYGGRRVHLDSRAAEYLCRAGVARRDEPESQPQNPPAPRRRRRYKRRDLQAEGDE